MEDIQYKFLNIPTIDRSVELFINPDEDGWQDRYYKALFDVVDFEYVYGNFTTKQHIVSDSIQINQKLTDLYDKVSVADSKLTFTAHNGFGIPLSFSYDLFGKRTDGSQFQFVLDNNDQPIDAATQLYEIAQSEWFYDKSNSNLVFFAQYIGRYTNTKFQQ